MAVYEKLRKEKETVILDDNTFISCEFHHCHLIYRGGELPRLQQCHFAQCAWHLEEAAQRTLRFLQSIYHSGPGGSQLVEETLRNIRTR